MSHVTFPALFANRGLIKISENQQLPTIKEGTAHKTYDIITEPRPTRHPGAHAYDLYDLADESKQPCAFLPPGMRKTCFWSNAFNRPGFDRAEFSATLVDVAGLTRPEFDELKRRLCAATEPYRAESQWLYWLPFPAVGAVFALQATVLRALPRGVLPVVALFAVYAFFFAHAGAVASHNARVDEEVDGVLAELNMRKGRAVAALRREHVGACVGRRNRRSRVIVFGAGARMANAPGYEYVYIGRGATAV